jgi:D-alanine-D-alanine ligase
MTKIAILTGGESAEREIALLSSQFIKAQAKRFFEVMVLDFPSDLDKFLKTRSSFSLVVPVFHGRGGEDGQIQGFLETLKVPYLFSGFPIVNKNKYPSKCREWSTPGQTAN